MERVQEFKNNLVFYKGRKKGIIIFYSTLNYTLFKSVKTVDKRV